MENKKIVNEVIDTLVTKHNKTAKEEDLILPLEPTDKLELIFKKQILLQKRLKNTNMIGNQGFINIMTLAAIDELMESIRETPWKPWKKQQKFNQEKYKEEIIDLWHFVVNLSLAAGFDANTLYEMFKDKNKVNHKRQNTGY